MDPIIIRWGGLDGIRHKEGIRKVGIYLGKEGIAEGRNSQGGGFQPWRIPTLPLGIPFLSFPREGIWNRIIA